MNESVIDMSFHIYSYVVDSESVDDLFNFCKKRLEEGILPDFDEKALLSEIKDVLENQSFLIDYDNDLGDIYLPTYEMYLNLNTVYDLRYGSMLFNIKNVINRKYTDDYYETFENREDELDTVLNKFYNEAKKAYPKWLNINRKVDNMAKKYYKENGKPQSVQGESYSKYSTFYESAYYVKSNNVYTNKLARKDTINNVLKYSFGESLGSNVKDSLSKAFTFIFGKPEVWKKKIKGMEETADDVRMRKMLKKELVSKETKLRKLWDSIAIYLIGKKSTQIATNVMNENMMKNVNSIKTVGGYVAAKLGMLTVVFGMFVFVLVRLVKFLSPENKLDMERLQKLKEFYSMRLGQFKSYRSQVDDPKKIKVLDKSIKTITTILNEIELKIDKVPGLRELVGPKVDLDKKDIESTEVE